MAFHHHHTSTTLPQEMAFHHNPFTDNPSLSTGEDDGAGGGGGGGAGAPTWLNSSVFRQQNLLHLLSESEPRNDGVFGEPEGSKVGERRNRREEEEEDGDEEEEEEEESEGAWYKADILRHPLYEQLLSAHVSCLRIATPVDQLPRIDDQLSQSQRVVAKYSELGGGVRVVDEKELDQFMVCSHEILSTLFSKFIIIFSSNLIVLCSWVLSLVGV